MSKINKAPKVPKTLAEALRVTAKRLEQGDRYRWTHMGSCNCGHLAQTVTFNTSAVLHEFALQRAGDWAEQTREYCPTSGFPLDYVITALINLGATLQELRDLERLRDPKVLSRMPPERRRELDHRNREDVIHYMVTWAELLEENKVKQQEKELVLN